nr:hypothetical protein CFP56_33479 [Quercus suber]
MTVVDLAFGGRDDAKAYLTTHGLQVATVGWRVRIVEPPQGIEQVSALESFNTALRHNVNTADAEGRQREKQWHILFDDPHGRETERGLLAYLHRYKNGIPVLGSVLVVSVGVVMPLWTKIWRIGRFYGNAMRRAWFAKYLQLLTIHEQILGSILVTISHLAKQSQVMRGQELLKQYRHMLENELYSGQLKVLRQATELEYVMQARNRG